MAAERAPTRRKQCVFRRAFQRFPFGKCERKTRNNSSYDVSHKETSQHSAEMWLPTESTTLTLPPGAIEPSKTQLPSLEQATMSNGMYVDIGVSDPSSGLHKDHVSELGHSPPEHFTRMPKAPSGSMQISGTRALDTESPVSVMAGPPSPSVSSMDMDMEIDPETGERALE